MNPCYDVSVNYFKGEFDAVVEIPKGSKIKYEVDKDTGMLRVDRILHSAVLYPANYGFIPQSISDDEDPLDVLILGDESFVPLSVVKVRAIGVLKVMDQGISDDKIIAVHLGDPMMKDVIDINQLQLHSLNEIKQFFKEYKHLENKIVEVGDILDHNESINLVEKAIDLYKSNIIEKVFLFKNP